MCVVKLPEFHYYSINFGGVQGSAWHAINCVIHICTFYGEPFNHLQSLYDKLTPSSSYNLGVLSSIDHSMVDTLCVLMHLASVLLNIFRPIQHYSRWKTLLYQICHGLFTFLLAQEMMTDDKNAFNSFERDRFSIWYKEECNFWP